MHSRGPPFMWMVRTYTACLHSHPLRTTALSASLISSTGDVLAQKIECGSLSLATFDRQRTAMVGLWGLTWMGAPTTLWLRNLQARLPAMAINGDGTTTLHLGNLVRALAIHLGVFAPVTNAAFYGYKELFAGGWQSWAERYATRMQNEFITTTCFSWLFWTPAQALNFTLVPLHFRPIYLNSLMVLWTGYLSFSGHRRY